MVWKITPELQTAIDHVSEQKAVEFLEQAIKHISDGKAQLGTQQPKDGKNICFKPLVKQGSQDTLLIAIPERAFKAYNYSSFREAASEALAHVQAAHAFNMDSTSNSARCPFGAWTRWDNQPPFTTYPFPTWWNYNKRIG